MHVFDAAEVSIDGGGEDDDGDVGSSTAEKSAGLGAELSCAEMVVENRYIDLIELFGRWWRWRCTRIRSGAAWRCAAED
jgi:hypothetical protein